MKNPHISLKISGDGGKVLRRVGSHKIKRIYSILRAEKFLNCMFDVTVRYSKGGINSGVYKTKEDLIFSLRAFLEES